MAGAADRAVGAPRRAPAAQRPRRRRKRKLFKLYSPIEPRTYMVIAIGSFVLIFGGWWLAAEVNLAKDIFLPTPLDVWNRGVDLANEGTLWDDTRTSFVRITIGFMIASTMALPIGILIGTYRAVEAGIEPAVDFIRYMPAVAFVPLSIVWVGVDETQKWLIIWIGTFFQQVLLVMDNVKRVPREYVDIGYTLGMNDRTVLRRVVVPAAAPAIWDTLRITLGWAWTWLVVAELVAASEGLGHRIVVAQRFFQTDTIFLGILIIGLLGLIMDQTMKFTGKRIFRWAG